MEKENIKCACGIVCPGPSARLYNTRRLIASANLDFLVAVNGAVLLSEAFDFWAIGDREVFEACAPLHTCPRGSCYPTLWVPARWEADIHRSPAFALWTKYPRQLFSSTSNKLFAETLPLQRDDLCWHERTMFIAIAMAILRGATMIKLYGADLEGRGYFREGLENDRTRHEPKRWEEERLWLEQITAACAAHGIFICREGAA